MILYSVVINEIQTLGKIVRKVYPHPSLHRSNNNFATLLKKPGRKACLYGIMLP